jgi:hydroxyethylthiazole kinase-like uncharacterized protein yjeF
MFQPDFIVPQPLHHVEASRLLEQAAALQLPPHALMQRAGLAVARLALALAPHAKTIWLACGPGNNGGDGLEAAMHLRQWGKDAVVTWLGTPASTPADAARSYQNALKAGVTFSHMPPQHPDLCIDALLGIGTARSPQGRMADWLTQINSGATPVLAVDVPSGLEASTGDAPAWAVQAQHTLSLLTLKPGLFTAMGRDHAGEVWFDALGTATEPARAAATAFLSGAPKPSPRRHDSHKGRYGDVAVIAGAPGMTGAALLAASAALHAGAGRVLVGLLDGGSLTVTPEQPELMFRSIDSLALEAMTVVCGCGGGDAIRGPLARILANSPRVVMDADALNALAGDRQLETLLRARQQRSRETVLTPHPLEAARLLGRSAASVQKNRLAAAEELAARFGCTVVLKGSGTVLAAPGQSSTINPTGNARLATAGTGDVLAGMIGARMAAGQPAFQAAGDAVYLHGWAADHWPPHTSFTAGLLARSLRP